MVQKRPGHDRSWAGWRKERRGQGEEGRHRRHRSSVQEPLWGLQRLPKARRAPSRPPVSVGRQGSMQGVGPWRTPRTSHPGLEFLLFRQRVAAAGIGFLTRWGGRNGRGCAPFARFGRIRKQQRGHRTGSCRELLPSGMPAGGLEDVADLHRTQVERHPRQEATRGPEQDQDAPSECPMETAEGSEDRHWAAAS